jgi:hypothetical protein
MCMKLLGIVGVQVYRHTVALVNIVSHVQPFGCISAHAEIALYNVVLASPPNKVTLTKRSTKC